MLCLRVMKPSISPRISASFDAEARLHTDVTPASVPAGSWIERRRDSVNLVFIPRH